MKRILVVILLLSLTVPALAQFPYPVRNLRGKIMTYDPYYNNWVPLQFSVVELYEPVGGEWVLLFETMTNAYGFYIFYGVPRGMYYLQVNNAKNYQISVFGIDYRRYVFQDLPILYF